MPGIPNPPHLSAWILDHAVSLEVPDFLTEAERARLRRIRDSAKRLELRRSLVAVRAGLSIKLGRASKDIIIGHDSLGAPCLADPLHQNLSISRTEGWSAFAVSSSAKIGIDIEYIRPIDWRSMLSMVCTPRETDLLQSISDTAPLPFLHVWTAKEAIMKATGHGFRIGAKGIELPASFILGKTNHAELHSWNQDFCVVRSVNANAIASVATATA